MSEVPEDLRSWRLPRGRHGLPRELVERSQRERLLAGVVRACAENGYAATSVADVLEQAGVGRETFYEIFADKRSCALAAHEVLCDLLAERVEAAYLGPGEWPARARAALLATFEFFASDPAAARFLLIEIAGTGAASRRRYLTVFQRFVDLLDAGLGDTRPDLARASDLAVGAIVARIYEEVVLGRTAELPRLAPAMTYEMIVPYLGEAAAERERGLAERPRPRPGAGR